MTFWTLALRELVRRPGRTVLTCLGIVIGVAAIIAIPLSVESTNEAFTSMFETVAGRAELEIVREGLGGFDPAIEAAITSIPGVEAAVPVVQSPVAIATRAGPTPVLILGIDLARDRQVRSLTIESGQLPDPTEEGILFTSSFAAQNGFTLGSHVRIWTPTRRAELTITGLIAVRGAPAACGGAVAFIPLPVAQDLFGLGDQINSLQVVIQGRVQPEELKRTIESHIPAGFCVRTPGTRGALAQATFRATQHGLAALSAVSLVAAAFLILNTFLMSLGERSRQLAIIRSLGCTRRQLTRLLLRESLLLGILGTSVGILLGIALAYFLTRSFGARFAQDSEIIRFYISPFVGALILGPGLPVLATLLPARHAARRTILDSLLDRPGPIHNRTHRLSLVLGLLLLLVPIVLRVGMVRGWLKPEFTPMLLGPMMASALIAVVLLVSAFTTRFLRGVGSFLGRFLGTEGRLAVRYLARNQRRTGLTVAVLLIALVAAVAMGLVVRLQVKNVREHFARASAIDFAVRGAWPQPTLLFLTPISDSVANEIENLDGTLYVEKINWIPARSGKHSIMVLAPTFTAGRPLLIDLKEGDPDEVQQALIRGDVVISTTLAQRFKLKVGDSIPLETREGTLSLQIAGTATEYTGAGMALYLDRGKATKLFDVKGIHAIGVKARLGEETRLSKRLQEYCDERSLFFQSTADLRALMDSLVDEINGFVWGLILLAFVIAAFGIINTLTMNVIEQTRELGVLRAIGMSRRKVVKLILSQAITLALMSFIPGVILGIATSYAIHKIAQIINGVPVTFHVDPSFIVICFSVNFSIALIAGLLPIYRANRLKICVALRHE